MCACQNKNCGSQLKENFSVAGALGADIVKNLLVVARTGIVSFVFNDIATTQLARTIAGIAAENVYLKRILGIFNPATVLVETSFVTVQFGENNSYSLNIPAVTAGAKLKLAEQFRAAADKLQADADTDIAQTRLPFPTDH
ncbi:hypothetical protein [Sphingorhabdus sp.]|uniref:hypothetical protein n=1 Tax=Sphingorhabdus sp. TaxID=1902408 RepID=UPI003341DFD8